MKLTNRQLKSVVDLLMKEENEKKNLQINALKSKKNSLINESVLSEGDLKISDVPQQIVSDLDDFSVNYSQQQISKLNKVVYNSLADLLKRVTGESMSWHSLAEELEAFDTYEHEMQLANDIKAAIDAYVKSVAEAAVSMVGPGEPEDAEPRYSEYE